MKKLLVMVFSLIIVSFLSACGEKKGENIQSDVYDDQGNNVIDPLDAIYGKESLTDEDLTKIEEYKFPESYLYSVYKWDEDSIETGSYVYSDEENGEILLSIHENMIERRIVNSEMEDGRINTMTDVVLENGESYSVQYVNDASTLEYVSASVNTPTSTILYTFSYGG